MKFINGHIDRTRASMLFPYAAVDFPCEIGDDTTIWAFAHISRDAVIGSNCMIGEGVHVGPGVKIGNGCRIQNGAQLFEGVTLEENVFVGPHVVFTNFLTPRASRRTAVGHSNVFAPTLVKRGASIGANATILCGIEIGEFAMIGAGSVVTRSVRRQMLVYGNPAKHSADICECGEKLFRLQCPQCQIKYGYDKSGPVRDPKPAKSR
jgi:UDP-2-acetamido-3-amino-2,3-dideoxy-glucuronate N-acetyltransferase